MLDLILSFIRLLFLFAIIFLPLIISYFIFPRIKKSHRAFLYVITGVVLLAYWYFWYYLYQLFLRGLVSWGMGM